MASELAGRFGAEIVSVDSMQVYRGMDIGTAKPSAADREAVRHHMIDVADPEEPFTVAEFQEAGRAAIADVEERQRPVLIVGGSGLHFRALVDPLEFPPSDPEVRAQIDAMEPLAAVLELLDADPDAAEIVDLANPRRVARALEVVRVTGRTPSERNSTPEAAAVRSYEPLMPVSAVGVDPGDTLAERIRERFHGMLEAGFVDEVTRLASRLGPTASQAAGYRELLRVVSGEWDLEQGIRRGIDATTSLSRRQRTFHRRDPRIRWLEWDDDPHRIADRAAALLEEAGWTS